MPPPLADVKDGDGRAARWLQVSQALLARAATTGGPLCVGVFVNATVEEMNGTAERVGLDLIQLHGAEGWEVGDLPWPPMISHDLRLCWLAISRGLP